MPCDKYQIFEEMYFSSKNEYGVICLDVFYFVENEEQKLDLKEERSKITDYLQIE